MLPVPARFQKTVDLLASRIQLVLVRVVPVLSFMERLLFPMRIMLLVLQRQFQSMLLIMLQIMHYCLLRFGLATCKDSITSCLSSWYDVIRSLFIRIAI